MSEVLQTMARRFSDRLSVHRRILAHLGITVRQEQASDVMGDLKGSLMACTRCAEPEICATWASRGFPGVPAWCRAKDQFDRLARATGAPELPDYDP